MNENMISGKWMNKNTGQIINVRDSVMDGDNMIIITNYGTIPMDEFANNYIQASDEIYDSSGKVISTTEMSFDEIANLHNAEIKRGNVKLFNDDTTVINHIQNESISEVKPVNKKINDYDLNFTLIDKLFEKTNFNPNINIKISGDSLPKVEIKMLMDIYDINIDDISKYIIDKYINTENIIDAINHTIKTELL